MRQKILFATSIAALMVLLAFTSALGTNQITDRNNTGLLASNSNANAALLENYNGSGLTIQEMQAFQQFVVYSLVNYGIHSDKLDQLQYAADLNFANWYASNHSHIPASYRGISQENSSVILPLWENNNPLAVSDIQAVAEYEVSQNTVQNEINTTYVVNNHLGTLISNTTIVNDNQTANLFTYEYTKDNQSLVYSLIEQNGVYTPVDPYIRLNAFTIHWGWGGLISGTSYNIYFTFDNYNDALNFKNFLTTAITVESSVDYASTIIAWTALGAGIGSVVPGAGTLAGAIVGFIGGVVTAIQGNTDPVYVANTINGLFTNQEAYNGQFEVVYTLNAWEWGLVPEFSWWGYMNPGQVLTQIYKNVGLASNAESNFITVYNALASNFGTNVERYFAAPTSWYSIEAVLEGWT